PSLPLQCDLGPIGIEKVGVHSRHAAGIAAISYCLARGTRTTAAETLRRAGSLGPRSTQMKYLLMLAAAAYLACAGNKSEDEVGAAPDRGDTTAVTATDTTAVPTGDTTGYTPTDTSTSSATPSDSSSMGDMGQDSSNMSMPADSASQ